MLFQIKKIIIFTAIVSGVSQHEFSEHNPYLRTENPGNETCLHLPRNNNIYGKLDNCLQGKSSYF